MSRKEIKARYRCSKNGQMVAKAYLAKWRATHSRRDESKRRYAKHKEEIRAKNDQWRQKNPEVYRLHNRLNSVKYRARKKAATTQIDRELRLIYKRARELRQEFNVVVDHIIPLAKGGCHAAENLQIIYASENAQKGARLDFVPSVIFT